MSRILHIFFALFIAFSLKAQINIRDSILRCGAISGSGAFQIPGGDLAERFGNNAAAGLAGFYKTKQNFVYGFSWSYLFGDKIYESGVLDSISTSDGFVIDREGKMGDIRKFERGFTLSLTAGKIFSQYLSKNRNSGPIIWGGVGYLQHKIRIYDNGARTPQLSGDYLKGYDRLTSGLMLTEFIGYWYMSNNRYINFYAGFEFMQGFTKSRRSWDYDLMRRDTQNRIDLLSGFRVGWNILLYKRASKQYYFY